MTPDADLILVGGGLANGLLALRLRQQRPELRVLLLSRAKPSGQPHLVVSPARPDPGAAGWLAPLVEQRWPGYEVIFPALRRQLGSGYASIFSSRFHQHLMAELGGQIRLGVEVSAVEPQRVQLVGGQSLEAGAVIDGRGVRRSAQLALGFRFLGQELRLQQPHGLRVPIIMDASVAQKDGYRFVYVLPLSVDSLLIEDTYYADGDAVAPEALRANIQRYAEGRGWAIRQVLREEQGVLPIVLSGDIAAFWGEARGVPQSGLSAALFHPPRAIRCRCGAPGRSPGRPRSLGRRQPVRRDSRLFHAAVAPARLLPPAQSHAVRGRPGGSPLGGDAAFLPAARTADPALLRGRADCLGPLAHRLGQTSRAGGRGAAGAGRQQSAQDRR